METNIVSVKYEDNFEPKTFSGKAYSYFTSLKLEIGDLVQAPTQYGEKIARVTKTNIPEVDIENIKPYMKLIVKKIDKDKYLNNNEILEDAA